MPLLEITDMTVAYGRIEAVRGVSITVEEGELVTLIGANGAGKTTTMRAVSGIRPLSRGRIVFDGKDITRMKPHLRVLEGIVQAPEGRGIFPGMTVLENLEMGAYGRKFESKAAHDETLDRVYELFPRLKDRVSQVGGTLSGGEQQMLAMARTLSVEPAVLLLDEISMGLAPMIVAELYGLVAQIAAEGVAVILAEQFAATALGVATDVAVVVQGRIVAAGKPDDLPDDLAEAYLGGVAA
jgi:branched-chain amino acid transport system ATP-binding protein